MTVHAGITEKSFLKTVRGWKTKDEIAESLGVTRPTITYWVNKLKGKLDTRRVINPETSRAISEYRRKK